MSLTSTLLIGKSGLTSYQAAIEVTGENISNVNTDGYTRQKVVLENVTPTTSNGFSLGTGVKLSSVERCYDALMQQQLVTASSTSGYDSTVSTVLQEIEPSFNELTSDGLGSAITDFFQSWQDLSTNASGTAERQAVLSQAQVMCDYFNSMSTTLSDTITAQNTSLTTLTEDINDKLANIATLNNQIKLTEQVSGNANELKDQRDLLVKELAEQMGVKYTENSDGTTDVYVEDSSTSPATSYYLVQGNDSGSLSFSGSGDVGITDVSGNTTTVDSDIYTSEGGGTLWATLQLRDTIIPSYQAQLDTLASSVITQVNNLQESGYDIDGTQNSTLAFFSGSSASDIAVSISDTDKIAAADSADSAPGGNANALAIADLESNFTTAYSTMVSQVGSDVSQAETLETQDEAYSKQLETLRTSNSGVSLDEELTNLVMYQRSYQACAKIITTATEMLDTALAMVN
jgi:flagellar hook-associated protein 1